MIGTGGNVCRNLKTAGVAIDLLLLDNIYIDNIHNNKNNRYIQNICNYIAISGK